MLHFWGDKENVFSLQSTLQLSKKCPTQTLINYFSLFSFSEGIFKCPEDQLALDYAKVSTALEIKLDQS